MRRFGYTVYGLLVTIASCCCSFYIVTLLAQDPSTAYSTEEECFEYPEMTFFFPEKMVKLVGVTATGFSKGSFHIEDDRMMTAKINNCEEHVSIHVVYQNDPAKYGDSDDYLVEGIRNVRMTIEGAADAFLPISPLNSFVTQITDLRIQKSSFVPLEGTKRDSYFISQSSVPDFEQADALESFVRSDYESFDETEYAETDYAETDAESVSAGELSTAWLYRTGEILDGSWKRKCKISGHNYCDTTTITLGSWFKVEDYPVDLQAGLLQQGLKQYYPSWDTITTNCRPDYLPQICDYQVFALYIKKSTKTVQVTTEVNPVNGFEIPGIIAGYFGYVTLLYSFFFRKDPKLDETQATKLTELITRKVLATANNVQPFERPDNIEDGNTLTVKVLKSTNS